MVLIIFPLDIERLRHTPDEGGLNVLAARGVAVANREWYFFLVALVSRIVMSALWP